MIMTRCDDTAEGADEEEDYEDGDLLILREAEM
eukprot:CAMPEP_0204847582 /NCGR_PEP_ID=MMETSP1347-20130617/2875_1 /ASSEMBLY_ACC=CAM_ASM_000690 /TAXON_ID=215587 /ORGANISM="Aplanochytrium stocchinoi, Strain GSBS06" /LENGTH=32 /DNA_ID= /DNA_START= /DNA_END= /DNA_ORIENTATION=